MEKSEYLSRELEPITVSPRSVSDLLDAMSRTGFQGKTLARAYQIIKKMIEEPRNTVFLGYSGSLSTTGQWKIVKWLVENRYVDVIVSTGANVSEDLVEALGFAYFEGTHMVDDADLLRNQIDRYYDVYVDELQYRKMEGFLRGFMAGLDPSRTYSSAEFLYLFGKHQAEKGIDSITSAAYRAGVPIFSPALADSGYGVAAYLLYKEEGKRVTLDQFKDFTQLGDIGERAEGTSVIYIGGGVPKDTIQLVTVMESLARGGDEAYPHKYAVQITTDSPQWGGLSGCTFEEAVSWGKISTSGDKVACYCDATIALPIISHALAETVSEKRVGRDFSWLLQS